MKRSPRWPYGTGNNPPTKLRKIYIMKSLIVTSLCAGALAVPASGAMGADTGTASPAASQEVTRNGSRPSTVGPAEFFTGRVRADPVWLANSDIPVSGSMVTFEPGARSAWHVHPGGQRLVVASGLGFTQEWGKPIQQIGPGDVVWCPPGVKHWHGATPTTAMTHMVVTASVNGKNVEWMEKVSDEQYNAR